MPEIITDDGVRLNYLVEDYREPWRGEPDITVLLYHGFMKSLERWTPFVPAVARRYRVVRFDVRGTGKSGAPPAGSAWTADRLVQDALNVVDALGIAKVHWAGFESAGILGLIFAAAHPERVASIACFNTPFRSPESEETMRKLFACGYPTFEEAIDALGVERWMVKLCEAGVMIDRGDPAVMDWVVRQTQGISATIAKEWHGIFRRTSGLLADAPGRVTAPVLLVAGAKHVHGCEPPLLDNLRKKIKNAPKSFTYRMSPSACNCWRRTLARKRISIFSPVCVRRAVRFISGAGMRNAFLRTTWIMIALALSAMQAPAATFPTKPVRMIVPYAAGGGADIVGRLVAQRLGDGWGQTVMIDNRPGAGGNIGTEIVARAPADGYTLLVVGPNHTVNISLYSKIGYDPVKDFAPISVVTSAPYLLLVNPSVGVNTVADLTALAKARPGKVLYASAGNGTAGHLGMELIKTMAGIDIVHIPYKGSPPALTDLIAGQVSAAFDNVLSAAPHVKAGRLRAIAVSTAKRSTAVPEVPTVAESGLPGFEVAVWQGVLAPAGTPKPVVDALHAGIVAALARADMKERMAANGADIIGNSPAEFAAFIKTDIVKWAKVVKSSGARVD